MKKKLFLLGFFLLLFSVSASAESQKMLAPSYRHCFDYNHYYYGPPTDQNIRDCLRYAYPSNVSECELIPERFAAEFKEGCYSKTFACERVSSPELKQQCRQAKTAHDLSRITNALWASACFLLPLAIFGVIAFALFELVRRKMTRQLAKKRVLLFAVLVVVWIIVVILAPPCVCTVCFY